jgi:FMN phosphatase YigB (HAD superfamily)
LGENGHDYRTSRRRKVCDGDRKVLPICKMGMSVYKTFHRPAAGSTSAPPIQRARATTTMIRGILFDLQGTLVDFHPTPDARALFEAGAGRVYAYLTAKGCSLPAFEPFCKQQRTRNRTIDFTTWLSGGEPDGRRLLRRLCKDFGLQRDAQCLLKLGWLWYEPVLETAEVAADVIPTLTALRDGDVKLGLVVNTLHQGEVIDRHLEQLGLLEFFPVRCYSTEIGARKPHPNLLNVALNELELPAMQTLFVGDDMKEDILGPRRLGMQTVLRVPPGSPPKDRGLADHVITNLAQLLEIWDIAPTTTPSPPQPMTTQSPTTISRPFVK